MGMYTEFHFNAELKEDTPEDVLGLLRYMTGETRDRPDKTPDHELFETGRWFLMLCCDSAYFDMSTASGLHRSGTFSFWYLSIRTNFKNYDNEIDKFLDWIHPYLNKDDAEFLGFYRYEDDENPTLIYMKECE